MLKNYSNNKEEKFYIKILSSGETKLIGDKYAFIKAVSDSFSVKGDPWCQGNWKYDNTYIAFNKNDLGYITTYNSAEYFWFKNEYFKRDVCYLDNHGRIINPSDYLKEVMIYKNSPKQKYYLFGDYRCTYQKRHYHTGYTWRRKSPVGIKRLQKLDEALSYDLSYEAAGLKVKGIRNLDIFLIETDEKARHFTGNWKKQYKCRRQFNIHSAQRRNESIRKYGWEDFSDTEVDRMLEEDFQKGFNKGIA